MENSLASKLRTAREERGLSLADVAHVTRIPVPRLKQMEEGNWAAFGSMAYARGFIRGYSQFLGIDPTYFVKELPEPIFGGSRDYRYLTDTLGPWIDPRLRSSQYGQRDPSSASARGVYALVLFLVLGICSAVLAHNFLFPKPASEVDGRPAVAVQAVAPVGVAIPASTAVKAKPVSVPAPASKVPFTPKPVPPKFVSIVTEPAEEVQPADVLRVLRSEQPAEATNPSPPTPQ